MGKNNEPTNIQREHNTKGSERLVEALSLGTYTPLVDHKTTITCPNGAIYTGGGHSQEDADKEAGDKYRNGESDDK